MSLLDNGPDTVQIWPEVDGVDPRGNAARVPGPQPVTIGFCRLQPLSSTLTSEPSNGSQTTTEFRLTARTLPLGPWALVQVTASLRPELVGVQFDVVGEPALHGGSVRTRHATAILRARAPRAA